MFGLISLLCAPCFICADEEASHTHPSQCLTNSYGLVPESLGNHAGKTCHTLAVNCCFHQLLLYIFL